MFKEAKGNSELVAALETVSLIIINKSDQMHISERER
jgi:hypothetical protein